MLTNNYLSMRAVSSVFEYDSSHISSSKATKFPIKTVQSKNYDVDYSYTSGARDYFFYSLNFRYMPVTCVQYTSCEYGGVCFGNGTAEPTKDDCQLSGDLVTGYTSSSVVSVELNGSQITQTATYTLTNTSDNDIIISEVGYIGKFGNSSSYFNLLDRTLLDEPVTIPAGGIGQVTYTINFNIA